MENTLGIDASSSVVGYTILDEELQVIEKNSTAKEKNDNLEVREIKSSAPIEVVTIEDKVTKEKPKKKGWWSK